MIIIEPHPVFPHDGPQQGIHGELPDGGPQEGVSGEMGANPGELSPDGGPQEGVSGEMGANPGELSAVESGEAAPGDSGIWAARTLSESETGRFSPSLLIYIGIPFCFIARSKRYAISYDR